MKAWMRTTIVAAFAMAVVVGCGSLYVNQTPTLQVRLMETSDLHAYMLGYDYTRQQATQSYGLAHTAAVIHQARAEQPNNVLFDNGDLIQGSALGDWVAEQGVSYLQEHVHPVIAALNYLQYDAGNLGNHEFNFGLDFLEQTLAGAHFPYVSANVFYAENAQQAGMRTEGWERPLVNPYTILERSFTDTNGQDHTLKIGVLGLLPPQIMTWDAMHLNGKVYVRDMVAAAQYYVPKMRAEGADIVVAIPHSGLNDHARYQEFSEQASRHIATVPGIDAIFFGHQHRRFPGDQSYDNLPGVDNTNGFIYGVPAVSPGYWGSYLGIIDLTLEQGESGWQVVHAAPELRGITEAYDEELAKLLTAQHEATVNMLNEPLTVIDKPINSFFARVFPDTSTYMINQAQTWYGLNLQEQGVLPANLPVLSAAAPFRNGFQSADDYTNIPAGQVTLGHLSDLYVYPNLLQAVQVSGAQLREWLEMSALSFHIFDLQEVAPQLLFSDFPSFNFDVISGIEYSIDVTQPARYQTTGDLANPNARRIQALRFQGKPVQDSDQFIVMVNNYRAGGGGHFPSLNGETIIYEGSNEVRQVIAQYAREQAKQHNQLLVEPTNNWRLTASTPVTAVFRTASSAAAEAEAQRYTKLEERGVNEAGYAIYHIVIEK